MNLSRAISLADKWSDGHVCSLRDGEARAYHALCLEALKRMREQESLAKKQATSDWISVEERLPENLPENVGRKVIPCLVAVASCYPKGKPIVQKRQRQLQYYGSRKEWEWSRIGSSRVTHWMPLPEPPEVEV